MKNYNLKDVINMYSEDQETIDYIKSGKLTYDNKKIKESLNDNPYIEIKPFIISMPDNIKKKIKKEISKELSLEQLNEDITSIQALSDKDIKILCEIINEEDIYSEYAVSVTVVLDHIRDVTEGVYENIHSAISKWIEKDFVTFCIWKRNELEIFDFFKLYKMDNIYKTDVYFFIDSLKIIDYLQTNLNDNYKFNLSLELYNICVTTSIGVKSLDDYVKNLYRYDYIKRKFNNESLYDELDTEMSQFLNKGEGKIYE